MKKVSCVLFVVLLTAPCGRELGAQWSNNPSVNTPVCTALGDQARPQITTDGAQGCIIAWDDPRDSAANGRDIYAQCFTAAGVRQWAVNGVVICSATDDQTGPQLCSDDSGGAIIVWTDKRFSTVCGAQFPCSNIFAQRVRGDGSVAWAADGVRVDDGTNAVRSSPMIARDRSGGAIITWVQNPTNSPGASDIYAARLDKSGLYVWGPSAVCTADGDQLNPQIVSDSGHGAVIAWEDGRNSAFIPNADIYAQRADPSGLMLWTSNGVALSSLTGDQTQLRMTSDADSGGIVTYLNPKIGDDNTIYAQRVAADGSLPWSPASSGGVNLHGPSFLGFFTEPTIVSDDSGGAIVAFTECCYLGIEAQRVSSGGALLWGDNGIVVNNSSGDEFSPAITDDGSGGAIISWTDTRNGLSNHDIYSQRVDPHGNLLWLSAGMPISTASYNQGPPVMVSSGPGAAITAWEDGRNYLPATGFPNIDIYCDRASVNLTIIHLLDRSQYIAPGIVLKLQQLNGAPNGFDINVAEYARPLPSPLFDPAKIDSISGGEFWTISPLNLPPGAGFLADMFFSYDTGLAFGGRPPSPNRVRIATRQADTESLAFSSLAEKLMGSMIIGVLDVNHFSEWVPVVLSVDTSVISLDEGWNMVSVPRLVDDYLKASVYTGAVSSAFAYQAGYLTEDTLANGVGYWIKTASADTVHVAGTVIPTQDIDVVQGWNLIGSNTDPVAAISITSNPPGMIVSQFFGYAGGYTIADTLEPGRGYWVRANQSGRITLSSTQTTAVQNRIRIVPTSEPPPPPPSGTVAQLPKVFRLEQNYPNPFNPNTIISYSLPVPSHVTLKIYNVTGQGVATLIDRNEDAGFKSVVWNASQFASGLYYCRMDAEEVRGTKRFSESRKMLLVK